MIRFAGKVMMATDEYRDIPVKDSNGVPTNQVKNHRFTKIQLLVKDSDLKLDRVVLCTSIDQPQSFELPKNGSEWNSPEIRRYDVKNGVPEATF